MSEVGEATPVGHQERGLRPAPGDCLGRYTLTGRLGAGGMGEVFSAVDPELERQVAIKVLRPGRADTSLAARARFQREAQAMARLNHPNVVSVHDVGTVGDKVFVAMELVVGPNLAEWLRERPRPLRAVVDVLLQAGRGLQAAHAAGIVHRDFKPSNVIVGDRVRVADFGLARELGDATSELEAEDATRSASVLAGSVTETGAVIGTPAYMSPEQRKGQPATPLSDQYSFALALREALPSPVPKHLRRLLDRALAEEPADRYPSMAALLVDLARDPARTRRAWLAAAATVALVVAAVVVRGRMEPAPCANLDRRLGDVWDAPRKAQVRAAFAATALPYAVATWNVVSRTLDDYAARWVDMATDACVATRVEGRQSDSLMDLRMACLERRRAVLGELTSLWARGSLDREGLEASGRVQLPTFDECADTASLGRRIAVPSDPATAARVATTRHEIATAQALYLANRRAEAKTTALDARRDADAIGWPELQAEAASFVGFVLNRLHEKAARDALLEAQRLGAEAHDDHVVAHALVGLVENYAMVQQDGVGALVVADVADGFLRGVARDDDLALTLLRFRGEALVAQGKFRAAREVLGAAYGASAALFGAHAAATLEIGGRLADITDEDGQNAEARQLGEQILAARIELFGENSPQVARDVINLGVTANHAGDYDAAVAYDRRAIAVQEKILPPGSPQVGLSLNSLAVVELERGQVDEAETLLERARTILEERYGVGHVQTSPVLVNLVDVRARQGRVREALELVDRVIDIRTKAHGPDHPTVAIAVTNRAELLVQTGDYANAEATFRQAGEIFEKAQGPDHPHTLQAHLERALPLFLLGRCGEVVSIAADAEARMAKKLPADHPLYVTLLDVRSRCDVATGRASSAVDESSRALAISEKHKVAGAQLGSLRWQLALAQAAAGRRAEATKSARQAEAELGNEPGAERDRRAVRAWLISANASSSSSGPRPR